MKSSSGSDEIGGSRESLALFVYGRKRFPRTPLTQINAPQSSNRFLGDTLVSETAQYACSLEISIESMYNGFILTTRVKEV